MARESMSNPTLGRMTPEEFRDSVIAQDYTPEGYGHARGWLAGLFKGVAYLAYYNHCSCCGTFSYLGGDMGPLAAVWDGPPRELLAMAQGRVDPNLPQRTADTDDTGYRHLLEVYTQVRTYFEEHPEELGGTGAMTEPLTPQEVRDFARAVIPVEVFDVFNELIVKYWDGTESRVPREDAVVRISQALHLSRDDVFKRRLLGVEEAYSPSWTVTCETMRDTGEYVFIFRPDFQE